MQEDYVAWPGARPAEKANLAPTTIPARPFEGNTDYSDNFTDKHLSSEKARRPEFAHLKDEVPPSGTLYRCTEYGHEYIKKPISAKYNACVDRPWMNCDSCVPTELPSPAGGCGLEEKTWTMPPFAIGRAVLQSSTEHLAEFKNFAKEKCDRAAAPTAQGGSH